MKKNLNRVLSLVLALCLALPLLTCAAGAADYYPAYTGNTTSIVTAMNKLGIKSSYEFREKVAAANGISGYRGTAAQNTKMLNLLKQGKLVIPGTENSNQAQPASGSCFAAYTGKSGSIVDALNAIGAQSGFDYRSQIAAANGIAGYQGSADQNIQLLNLLKQGKLVKPGTPASQPSTAQPVQNAVGFRANLSKVKFIRQVPNSCKASSAAMAASMITGRQYQTSDMVSSGSTYSCKCLQGYTYKGSNGITYTTTYKFDPYVGSEQELRREIDRSVSEGLPIVIAVHKDGVTNHHWIVVTGKDSKGNLLVVDTGSGSGSGSTMASREKVNPYKLGITSYSDGQTRYGYISFQKVG